MSTPEPSPSLRRTALCAAVLLMFLCGGCATRAMKGTPFFTGEYEGRLGPPEDRINLWPLLYYRDPALSFLWPIGEKSDQHFALRPLLSMYREEPDEPYSEFNLLWPFIQFDTKRHEHRVFPVFWNHEDAVVFPLYWHFDRPFAGPKGTDALFPLWIYERKPDAYDLHLGWPFVRFHDSPRESGWRVWPLVGHRAPKDSPDHHTFWLWPLGRSERTGEATEDWFLPFYACREDPSETLFASLVWIDRVSAARRTRAVPAALSWRRDNADGSASLSLLLGLYRDARSSRGERRGHLVPLYAYGPRYTVSPLYARATSDARTLDVVPPLLSWQRRDAATGRTDLYAAGGLLHRRRGVEGQDRDWLLPFYYRDEAEGTRISPLWADRHAANGDSSWTAVPPLLSWQRRDAATGRADLYAAGGLLHRRRGIAGQERDWLLPIYYRDEAEGTWITPLWAGRRAADGDSSWTALPPLLSWQSRDPATGRESLYLGGGLFHRRRGVDGQDRDWLLPLFYRDEAEGELLTPLYARWRTEKSALSIWPPLLSWNRHDAATPRDDLYLAGGLFHRGRGVAGRNRDWLLPLYYHSQEEGLFLSPLYAAQQSEDRSSWALIPPLLTFRRQAADGARDTFALGGAVRWGRDAEGRRHGHAIPFYLHGPGRFLSLPYASWTEKETQRRVQAIPPLLSWQSRDPATGHGDRFALLGLFHERFGVPSDQRAGHLLPFYAYDRASDSFLTPLFGHWRSGGTRYDYFATPFVGSFHGASRGFWAIPFGGRSVDDTARITYLLWGRFERRNDGTGSASFFPVFHHRDYGDPASLLRAMDADEAPAEWVRGARGRETDWLLFLGTGKHVVSGQRGTWGRDWKTDEASAEGLLFRETRESRLFPLWSSTFEREVGFDDAGRKQGDGSVATRSLLLCLYDGRKETSPSEKHDYVRHRVLWRLWHYERLNGDSSLDVFPAITWDRRADGARKFTFFWRLFRNETDAEGRRKLDILFLPILRP